MRAFRGAILFLILVTLPTLSRAQVMIEAAIAPPVLPVYEQPPIPGPGYIWTPGYWAYGGEGYYWVPGAWVLPPRVGLLWTPGYWGWRNGVYAWNAGYWGRTVGFYGGVAYGFGYTGTGYAGGYWRGGDFMYNRTVNNFGSTNITNVYNKTVVVNSNTTKVSFNGGPQGIQAQPNAAELAAAKQPHVTATSVQMDHVKAASADKRNLASTNNGHPPGAATAQPGALQGKGAAGTATTTTAKPTGNASPQKLNAQQSGAPKDRANPTSTASVPHTPSPNAQPGALPGTGAARTATTTTAKPTGNAPPQKLNAQQNGKPNDRARLTSTARVPQPPHPNAQPVRPARAAANPRGPGHPPQR